MADMKSDPAEKLTAIISDITEYAERRIKDAVDNAKKETEEIRAAIVAMRAQRVEMFEKATVLLAQEFDIRGFMNMPADRQKLESVGFTACDQTYNLLTNLYGKAGQPALPYGRYRVFFALVPIKENPPDERD